ncbi:CzcB/NccB family metal efflux transporter periplasmic adaptor subunit [Aquifex aeolicus]|uniref:Cation efflux system (CzcB-like) n=1 Tax=Aquifex aeolicus (strain VF5) TaxID=224324 RepID=O66769_AQUAE|nr:CzcB/NccB family metal efflux transporter periplasmic adaptor subunit [Aquifex aeolicus]AAC06725.1 cation efflux system (czcB-like) [Aquifex aeolicus VF5]
MKKILIYLITLLAFSFGGEEHGHEEEIHLTDKQIKLLGIKLYEVKREPVGKIVKMPAEVEENPLLNYVVYSPVEGIVRKLYKKEGDLVKKGEPLAEVYSPELANLIGEVRTAKVRMESARKLYERYKKLYEQKVIKYTLFYNAMVEYERAKGEYEALLSKLKSFGEVKGYNLVLRSPGKGYVVKQNVVLGESVGLDNFLFKIHSHEVVWVYGWADEKSAKDIKEGMKGTALSHEDRLPCRVDYIGHEVDRKTRRVKVRCVAQNKNHVLKPGMFVELLVKTQGEPAILIPKNAVQEIEGKKVVFVRTEEGFEARPVTILKELNGYYVVLEGLKEGERIAVTGTVFLKTKLVGVEEGGHAH